MSRTKLERWRDVISKLKTLSEKGDTYERQVAKKKLDALVEKYDIHPEDFDDSIPAIEEFYFHNWYERTITKQVAYKVIGSIPEMYAFYDTPSGRRSRNRLGVLCTKAQKLEIEYLVSFYIEIFKKDMDFLLDTFIQKHELYGVPDDEASVERISYEEAIRRDAMAAAMTDATPYKALPENL